MCVMASPVLACNIKAISVAESPRYNALISRLRSAMRDRRELPDGYRYTLDSETISLPEIAEWITMERLCCPFLSFQLEVVGGDTRLGMRGPDGAKAILEVEFSRSGVR
jgi:hypothetical protein